MGAPKYSVVIPTLGRKDEVLALLDSISRQEYEDLEVIIVDQNADERLIDVVTKHKEFYRISHLRVSFRGASRARNYGALRARGDIIFFPDDDAELLDGFFEKADMIFSENPGAAAIFGKCVDREGFDSVMKFAEFPGSLTIKKHVGMFVEATMLIRRDVFSGNNFDEGLGVGTFHGAEEAYDLVLRLIGSGLSLYYDPNLIIYHPNKVMNYQSDAEIMRVFTYRCGFAKLCRKHRLYRKLFSRVFALIGYMPYLVLMRRSRLRYYCAELAGIFSGLVIK